MVILLATWVAVGAGLAWVVSRRTPGSAGLPFAYFLGTGLIHVPGALLYLDADQSDPTRIGFQETTIGMVAFLVGVLFARSIFASHRSRQLVVIPRQKPGSL